MNYRHAFHAGNFADVFKHALLARLLTALGRKDAAYFVLDTHAGAGLYDLAGEEAARGGEWREGLGRIEADPPQGETGALLAPWRAAVAAARGAHGAEAYPGSPLIAQHLMRPQDRLICCDLHEETRVALAAALGRDRRAKALGVDGYVALGAHVPPKERRGLALIDPPFERRDEFATLARAAVAAQRKWATGVYALWHPVKDVTQARGLADAIAAAGVKRVLRVELLIGADGRAPRGGGPPLIGCGLVVINPPFGFVEEARALASFLAARLSRGAPTGARVDVVAGE